MKTVETTNTIVVETPASADVQVKTAPKSKGKKSDAAKIEVLEKAAKKAGNEIKVTIEPKAKASGKAKKAAAKSADEIRETQDKQTTEKAELPAPLKVDGELLKSKIQSLHLKLQEQKRETSKSPHHVAYGYFLAKTKAGRILALEYHEALKPCKWIARDLETKKVVGKPAKTMHDLHETVVKEF